MLELHMIPTGGDSTLLRFREDWENEINILIDGGNRRDGCIDYLNRLGIRCIDLLIVSHLDEDHIKGLRRVVEEVDVEEIWITDISPLIQPAIEEKFLYMMKVIYEASLIIDAPTLRGKKKLAVYDGYEKQIGPFYLKVLSPPKSLHNYLRRPDTVKKILESRKGQTIKNYVRALWKDMREGKRGEQDKREEMVSEIVERFKVDIPQIEEIKDMIDKDYDPTYWQKIDKYYESARSLFNDISIVVSITYNYRGVTKRFLFPGDLTNWSIVLAKYPQLIRKCILKIPHHGGEIYYDPEAYSIALLAERFNRNFQRSIRKYWKDCIILYPCFPSNEIYEWLEPEIALVYPFKNQLPKLSVRNRIINASRAVVCTYRQGMVNKRTYSPSNSCIECYNCTERVKPIVFRW